MADATGPPPSGPEGRRDRPEDEGRAPDQTADHPTPQTSPTAGRRGPVALRPMRVGELLDATVTIYRARWSTFMGIVAFVYVPLSFVEGYVLRDLQAVLETGDPVAIQREALDTLVASLGAFAIVAFVLTPLLIVAMVKATADVYLGGRPTVGQSYRFAFRRVG